MKQRLEDAFEVCSQALKRGADLEACLRQYPDLEPDLRPILEAHYFAKTIRVADPSPSAIEKSRLRMLARAQEVRPVSTGRGTTHFPRVAGAVLAMVLVFIIGGGGIYAASAAAVPGDALYPLKLTFEDISITLAPSQLLKSALQATYSGRRLEEAQELLALEREEEIVFEGIIAAIGQDGVVIDDINISITDDTDIVGSFKEGDRVEISALIRDGVQVEALKIRLRSYWVIDFVMTITDEYWEIGDSRLRIDESSLIEQGLSIGDRVLVVVRVDEDGSVFAQSILREAMDEPPIATPSPDPTPSETPTPDPQGTQIVGVVQEMTQDLWNIGFNNVLITDETEIQEGIAIGDFVRVDALVFEDGTLIARKIELRAFATDRPHQGIPTPVFTPIRTQESTETSDGGEDERVEFTGILQSAFANRWLIGGQFVFINESTEIVGEPKVGDLLDVEAVTGAFGRLEAVRIEVISD